MFQSEVAEVAEVLRASVSLGGTGTQGGGVIADLGIPSGNRHR
jgi:hypothetical protein